MNNQIWTKRTPATINEWLRAHADGFRIQALSGGEYTVYRRFMRDKNDPDRTLFSGDLSGCRVAIMGAISQAKRRLA